MRAISVTTGVMLLLLSALSPMQACLVGALADEKPDWQRARREGHPALGCIEYVGALKKMYPNAVFGAPYTEKRFVVVRKSARRIMVFDSKRLVRTGDRPACYWMGLAAGAPEGPKRRQGDLKTPEGWYRTSDKPWSQFSHAIAVHYPNNDDAATGKKSGLLSANQVGSIKRSLAADKKPLQNTKLGGEILIHGDGGRSDWTLGCVGMENDEIKELRSLMPKSQRFWVLILP